MLALKELRVGHKAMMPDNMKIRPMTGTRSVRFSLQNADVADSLLVALGSRVPGEAIFLDVPEINRDALQLVAHHKMREVFGCARMILGPIPQLPDNEIFGVTTFELG